MAASNKIKIEISLDTWTKVKKMFENNREIYEKLKLGSVDDFINYILENFAKSSKEFEQLSDQMKSVVEKIDIDNIDFEDLFKNIAKSSKSKDEPKKEVVKTKKS